LGLGILTEARRHRYSIWGNPGNDEHVKASAVAAVKKWHSKLYSSEFSLVFLKFENEMLVPALPDFCIYMSFTPPIRFCMLL
jgi:hypothetical protein